MRRELKMLPVVCHLSGSCIAGPKPRCGNPITRIPGNRIRIHSMRPAMILVRLAGLRSENPL